MDQLEAGKLVYLRVRELVKFVAKFESGEDEVVWLLEDLQDALLDLKLAVVDGNRVWAAEPAPECRRLADELLGML